MITYFLTHLSLVTVAIIAALFVIPDMARAATARLIDRYRFDRAARRPVRRWYGTGARVRPPAMWISGPVSLTFEVDGWEKYERGSVWVRAIPLDEPGGDPQWFPLEALAPHQVPVFRPHLCGGVPHLTRYVPACAA